MDKIRNQWRVSRSHASQNEIAFEALRDFLQEIGFDRSFEINNSMAFNHGEWGTIITVSIPADGQPVRSADLLSVAMRLEALGLVEWYVRITLRVMNLESELEQFLSDGQTNDRHLEENG